MTTPWGPRPASEFSPWSNVTSSGSYAAGAVRAAIISLVLLAILAVLVLF